MSSARSIKIKVCRFLGGRGMLLLVPAVWICVLLWSARTTDRSARASLRLNRAHKSLEHRSNLGHHGGGGARHQDGLQERPSYHRQAEAEGAAEVKSLKHQPDIKHEPFNTKSWLNKMGFQGGDEQRRRSKTRTVS